jgi:peptidyl-prolyl cis-trans isomerase SurA
LISARTLLAGTAAMLALATAAAAQQAGDQATQPINSSRALNLPQNPQVFGRAMPSVIKATAMVNGEVITQTDVDQRVALLAIANGGEIPADQIDAVRQQVLGQLVDETLQIQAAKSQKIDIKKSEIDRALERVAANVNQTPQQMAEYLLQHGSSMSALRRQVEGQLAWRRLQETNIESSINVGDDEVKAIIDRMTAQKGAEEYRVGEIFLPATSANEAEVVQNAGKILQQLRDGASFSGFARQFSQASTAAVGGDLGWVRPEQLPEPLAAAVRQMRPGTVSNPIPVPGGVSIIAVQDSRKVLTADARDAILSLKQVSIAFPAGITRPQAEPVVARFAEAVRNIGGCGGVDKLASEFNAQVVENDQVKIRDLPPAVQELVLPVQVGQATQPFGSLDEGVRTLVICGRDQPQSTAPSFDDVYNRLSEDRVNSRSRRYLADLRRDAVIEFR